MHLLLELAQKMVETMPWIGAISFDLGPAPVLKEIQCKGPPVRLLGGPSCAAGAESLIIAVDTYCGPGVSCPG